jgi:membrane protein YdbS with pleckstrin-like domain
MLPLNKVTQTKSWEPDVSPMELRTSNGVLIVRFSIFPVFIGVDCSGI